MAETFFNKQATKDQVDHTTQAYRDMAEKWPLIHDLLGGSDAMRKARQKWLPIETAEETNAYERRLKISFLYNAFGDTIDKVVAKPFSKAITIVNQELLPDPLQPMIDNVGTNKSIAQLGKDTLRYGATYGLTHLLIDNPKRLDEDGNVITLPASVEMQNGDHPVVIEVTPPNLLGWRTRRAANGQEILSQVRIRQIAYEQDGAYGTKKVERILVYNESTWEKWKKGDDDKWGIEEKGPHTYPGVPLVTYYVNRTGFLTGMSPYDKLADMNLAHWQSSSDQRNILRFSRFGILFASGFEQEELDNGLEVGPSKLAGSVNTEADLKYVEHSGKAIEAGEEDLRRIEERMETLGSQPFMTKFGNVKATGQAIHESKSMSLVQAWVQDLEETLHKVFEVAGRWIGQEISDDFKIDIFNDFTVGIADSQDSDLILKAAQTGLLSQETMINEWKRRGKLAENVDPEQERDKIAEGTL